MGRRRTYHLLRDIFSTPPTGSRRNTLLEYSENKACNSSGRSSVISWTFFVKSNLNLESLRDFRPHPSPVAISSGTSCKD